jgi:hypothetical protein
MALIKDDSDLKAPDFSTKDIYLAAALLCTGASLEDTVRDDPRHMRFEFSCDSDMASILNFEQVERDYNNGKLMVSASKYAESIRKMKSIIHSTD